MNNAISNYMSYLKNVLGLRGFISSEGKAPFILQFDGTGPLGFVFSGLELSKEEQDLFEKILKGMKLDKSFMSTVCVSQKLPFGEIKKQCAQRGLKNLVFMTQEGSGSYSEIPYGQWQVEDGVGFMKTTSLSAMLANEDLKRECWGHLKTVLKEVSH